jgi:hypothetical protein
VNARAVLSPVPPSRIAAFCSTAEHCAKMPSVEPDDLAEQDHDAGGLEPEQSLANKIGTVAAALLGLAFVIIAIGAALAALAAGVILVIKVLPGHVTVKNNPGYLDNVFGNRWIVWAARVALLGFGVVAAFTSLYVCASIIMRMVKGHWLRSAGPFQAEVEQAQQELSGAETWIADWQATEARNTDLSQHLEQANATIEWLANQLDEANVRLAELEGNQGGGG